MKKTWPILLGSMLLAAPVSVQAQFNYTTNADGITVAITGYTGSGGAVIIPGTINGLPVTSIVSNLFLGAGANSVTIPGSVTNIGADPFGGTETLTAITVNATNSFYSSVNGVLFDKNQTTLVQYPSFMGGSYTIPGSVTNIGEGAFEECVFLTSVTIPGSVTSIGDWAFENCMRLQSVTISNGLTSIGDYAFYGSGLTSVTIPASVTRIGDWAFEYCRGLTSVTIPGSVTKIGDAPFGGCPFLAAITVEATNSFYSSLNGVLFDKSQTTLVEYPNRAGAAYIVPSGATSIGAYAFYDTGLASVTIPASVTSIGNYAFYDSGLGSVTIPASVTNIGDAPFADCANLLAITVNATNSFYSSVNGVLFDKNQTTLVQSPCRMGGSYTIPAGVISVGDEAFTDCQRLTSVTIPASVTNIGTNAFYSCPSLTAITVNAQNSFYTSVNGVLFDKRQTTLIHYPCGRVGGYTIPDGVTNIEDGAFDGLLNSPITNLTSVTIPGSVISIGNDTFQGLAGLTNVTIADGVTSIGVDAFEDCTGLASVTIPGSVTSIANYAFDYCPGLTRVYFTGNAPAANSAAFAYDNATVYYLSDTTGWGSTFAGVPAVLWNPVIQTGDGSFGMQNGLFGFNITGTTNIPIVVEACTNLACPVWLPLQTLTLTNGSVYFSEPVQTNSPSRFYRIGSP